MRGKLFLVVHCLTVTKDLPTLDPGNSRQLAQQPVAKFLPLLTGQVEVLIEYFQWERLPAPKIPLWNVHGAVAFLQLIIDEQGKTETVVRRMDDSYTRERSYVRRSAAYGIQQRWVAVLTGRLHHHEISIHHFLSAIAYHTPAPA
ncbi:hypothetical protein T10_12465 [Trichinella papuae]|uniref:Uncharacterized protein n=1 Tax=Trichinella papuae TaxID=268474 RepID=A0A0V1MSV2_9BILA|nr:hypothetical protein T10_12465 [Trichinella papuae]